MRSRRASSCPLSPIALALLAGLSGAGCSRGGVDATDLAAPDGGAAKEDLSGGADLAQTSDGPAAGGDGGALWPTRPGSYTLNASCSSFNELNGMLYYGSSFPVTVEAELVPGGDASPALKLKALGSTETITVAFAADVRRGRVYLPLPPDETPRSAFRYSEQNTERALSYQLQYRVPRSVRLWHYYNIDGRPYALCSCIVGLDDLY